MDQPIHVLAGWLVPSTVVAAFDELCLCAFVTDGAEASKVRLDKSARQRQVVARLTECAVAAGAQPIFVLSQKRYCAAAKIVETFLDPEYNDVLKIPTGADLDRKEIAEVISRALDDPTLKRFMDAHRAPTLEAYTSALDAVCEGLASSPLVSRRPLGRMLARGISGARGHLGRIAEVERAHLPRAGTHAGMVSINLFSFVAFLNTADAALREAGRGRARLVHDETKEFEASFRFAFDAFASAPPIISPYVLQSGRRPRLGLTHIESFHTENSKAVLGVQAADRLAALVRHAGEHALRAAELGSDLLGALKPVIAGGRYDVIGDRSFCDRFVALLRTAGSSELVVRQTWPETRPRKNAP